MAKEDKISIWGAEMDEYEAPEEDESFFKKVKRKIIGDD